MTFRQCRTLCEMLRSLHYPRLVSLENFAKPNFQLVADLLYWLVHKYDPQANLSDDINEEKDRVQFMKAVISLFAAKARIKVNAKKLYQADGEAVPEIIKITEVLYKAMSAPPVEEEEVQPLSLPMKVSNLRAHKILSTQICELGARLYDSLAQQPELRRVRSEALTFLENMGSTGSQQQYIENSIKTIMQQQQLNTQETTKYVAGLEQEQRQLEDKLKKKTVELERAEKKRINLVTVKPAFMEEYERLEQELMRLQEIYVNKFRNIDFMEHELETYHRIEEEKFKKMLNNIEKIRNTRIDIDKIELKGDDELEKELLEHQEEEEERTHTRGHSRRQGNSQHDDLREESDGEEDDDQDEDGQSQEDSEDDDEAF